MKLICLFLSAILVLYCFLVGMVMAVPTPRAPYTFPYVSMGLLGLFCGVAYLAGLTVGAKP